MEIDMATSRDKIQHAQRFDPASHEIKPAPGGRTTLHKTA
jgi:hypothetical protein